MDNIPLVVRKVTFAVKARITVMAGDMSLHALPINIQIFESTEVAGMRLEEKGCHGTNVARCDQDLDPELLQFR